MKLYDISQEVFSCSVFPGDPSPERRQMMSISKGDIVNLTGLSMCAHNGTHVDSPYHFYKDGKTIDQISLEKFCGWCFVADVEGVLSSVDAQNVLTNATQNGEKCAKKILLKGKTVVSEEAAKVFAEAGIDLIGNESQTVGPENAPAKVHYTLLEKEVVLLEGIRLEQVPQGVYFLNAAPLNLGASDGSPCRAILIDFE